jgi:hypothetical protein
MCLRGSSKTIRLAIGFMLLGAVSYYGVDALLQCVLWDLGEGRWIFATLAPPISCLGAFFAAKRFVPWGPPAVMFALLGIWFFGPLCMLQIARCTGGPGVSGIPIQDLLYMIGFFPGTTFMMSAYDGTVFALGLITLLMFGLWFAALIARKAPSR